MPDFSVFELQLLEHPAAALALGIFGAVALIGLFRKFRKMVFIGVTGLILTTALLVWQFSG